MEYIREFVNAAGFFGTYAAFLLLMYIMKCVADAVMNKEEY